MLQGWVIVIIALAYIGFLFLVASYGDRRRELSRGTTSRLLIYPLSLAIYCTSWTFFGSVGLASRGGLDFFAIYIGPMVMVGLAYPLLIRIVRLAKGQNITSIADLIAARYGKSQAVAATVALIAIVGMVPYIALQLKAVSSSVGTILAQAYPGGAQPIVGDSRAVRGAVDGGVCGAVRHPPHRRHRASGRADAGDRDRVDRQAGGLPRRRHFRDLRDVSRPAGAVHPRARPGQYRGGAHPRAAADEFLRHDGAVAVRHRAVAAAIPCRGGREPQRGRDPPRRLAVPALSGAHQSVRAADRHGRPADVSRRKGRQRHVRAGAADRRAFRIDHAGRLRRRAVGGDRHGDRGIGGAGDHGVERHRGAAGAQAPRHASRRRAMPARGC